jgi:putative ABC transport system substrate-binding protein
MLHELVPTAAVIAVLVNPTNPITEPDIREMRAAAGTIGVRIRILNASSQRDLDAAFANLAQQCADALVVNNDGFLSSRRDQIVTLAAQRAVPAIYHSRDYVAAGGLVSYGADVLDSYRQVGVYVGRILKGVRPAELPVMLPTKFELVINLKTAKSLGLAVPPTLLAIADEVIE